MPGDAQAIREALQCDNPRCGCRRPRGQVHCPTHADRVPSLSLREKDGTVLIHCHAGCPQDRVIETLTQRGLWWGTPSPTVRAAQSRELLLDVQRFMQKYVVFPSDHAAVAVTLWTAAAWVVDAFDLVPYLAVVSAEMREGKSRVLKLLRRLTPRPWLVVQPSEAVLFRKIDRDQPTLLIDEAEGLFKRRAEDAEPMRTLLNSGFERGSTVPRCLNHGDKIQDYKVFGMKALALIGDLPPTLMDRSIVIRMRRATKAEQHRLSQFRERTVAAEAAPLCEALAEWAVRATPKLQDALRNARPAIPDALDGRAADLWEPLLAIADIAGDGWALLADAAAVALSTGEVREDPSLGTRLLADIKVAFGDVDRMPTRDLIEALCEDESSPWADWRGSGRRITPHGLRNLLEPYGVRPTHWESFRGYERAALEPLWARYVTPEASEASAVNTGAGFGDFCKASGTPPLTLSENGEKPLQDWPLTLPDASNSKSEGAPDLEALVADELAYARRWNARVVAREKGVSGGRP